MTVSKKHAKYVVLRQAKYNIKDFTMYTKRQKRKDRRKNWLNRLFYVVNIIIKNKDYYHMSRPIDKLYNISKRLPFS